MYMYIPYIHGLKRAYFGVYVVAKDYGSTCFLGFEQPCVGHEYMMKEAVRRLGCQGLGIQPQAGEKRRFPAGPFIASCQAYCPILASFL